MKRTLKTRLFAGAIVAPAAMAVHSATAYADIGSTNWSATADPLSTGSYENEVGFIQTLTLGMNVCVVGGSFKYDGIFGPATRDRVLHVEHDILNYGGAQINVPEDGTISSVDWSRLQITKNFLGPNGIYRLLSLTGSKYQYYAGGGANQGAFYYAGTPGAKWKYYLPTSMPGATPFDGQVFLATTSLTQTTVQC